MTDDDSEHDTELAPTSAAELAEPTTVLPPANHAASPEAWSLDDTADLDAPTRHSRLVWSALVALVVAIAGALIFLATTLFGSGSPKPVETKAQPTTTVPVTAPPAPPPITPRAPTTSLPSTETTTTSTSAVASGPAIGEPCNHWSKIARDPNTGLTIICDGGTGRGATPHWTTDDLSHVIGVETIGTSCAGTHRPFEMAISPDDYLVACTPADAGVGQLAGPGSTWQIYHP
jgi:hypothetical protein